MGLLVTVMRPFMRNPAQGADTAVYLASSPDAEGFSGQYFADRKVRKTRDSSYDSAITRRLWEVSADLVGLPVGRALNPVSCDAWFDASIPTRPGDATPAGVGRPRG